MGTNWDHEDFRAFVIAHAKKLGIADSTADLARATGIGHGMLSKWFRGQERPSPRSLERLAPAIRVNTNDLMVHAGYLKPSEVGMAKPPAAPAVVEKHPLVRELDQLLSDGSKLTEEERVVLAGLVDRVLAGWRPQRNGRRRTA